MEHGLTQGDNTRTAIPMCNFMYFYVFKMAVAIAFLRKNAVEAIKIYCISMILNLNGFYNRVANVVADHDDLLTQ